jgi:hypothetical protein
MRIDCRDPKAAKALSVAFLARKPLPGHLYFELYFHPIIHCPTVDLTRNQIYNNGQVQPAFGPQMLYHLVGTATCSVLVKYFFNLPC